MATKTLTRQKERFPSLVDEFFNPLQDMFESGLLPARKPSIPAANIVDQDKAYQLTLAVPGMNKDDFQVDVYGSVLTISADKEESNQQEQNDYTRLEYNYSNFNRSFSLPPEVNTARIEATYANGILKLVLPKKDDIRKDSSKKVMVR